MDISKCRRKLATISNKNNETTKQEELFFGPVRFANTEDGFCRVAKMKVVAKGRACDDRIDLSAAREIICDGIVWEVYQHQAGSNACHWLEVLRVRRMEVPCASPVEVCQCEKDETCDGGFYATNQFNDLGAIRKLRLRENVANGIRQNVWDYRYYGNKLRQICELHELKRILIKTSDGQFRIVDADFSGDCPFATVVKEKTKVEIREPESING